jgi:hypothetical protein
MKSTVQQESGIFTNLSLKLVLGLIFQVPMIGAQASVKISDLSSVSIMLLVSFYQRQLLNLGCTSSIRNLIVLSVPHRASDIDPAEVLAAFPANLRKAFTSEQLPGVTCHAWCIQEAQRHHRKIRRKHVVTVMVWGIGEQFIDKEVYVWKSKLTCGSHVETTVFGLSYQSLHSPYSKSG